MLKIDRVKNEENCKINLKSLKKSFEYKNNEF
jgi:hypothetical protein